MHPYNKETIYFAGPECFYQNGYDLWEAMAKSAEYYGFRIVMPTRNELKLDHQDLRRNADTIFENCAGAMNEATAIVADLELFRGSEPDGGTVFEIGMAYARGLRCYGYTRDKRDMRFKHQGAVLKDGCIYDSQGRPLAYHDLPFCPSLVASCKIMEGNYLDCLKLLMTDIDEERKGRTEKRGDGPPPSTSPGKKGRIKAYLASHARFDPQAREQFARMKSICENYNMEGVSPLDGVPDMPDTDPYARACHSLEQRRRNMEACDIVLADLNDFHGYEPSSDIAFECGMAWQMKKKCYGYLSSGANMRERIPNYGPQGDYLDQCGTIIENFDYPINLMFASSMPILEGDFQQAVRQAAGDLE